MVAHLFLLSIFYLLLFINILIIAQSNIFILYLLVSIYIVQSRLTIIIIIIFVLEKSESPTLSSEVINSKRSTVIGNYYIYI
jgi:hypothetical protein